MTSLAEKIDIRNNSQKLLARGWYAVKSKFFRLARNKPCDKFVDEIRKERGIIVKNQYAWRDMSQGHIDNINAKINALQLSFPFGRELVIKRSKGASFNTLEKIIPLLPELSAGGKLRWVEVNKQQILPRYSRFAKPIELSEKEMDILPCGPVMKQLKNKHKFMIRVPDNDKQNKPPKISLGYQKEVDDRKYGKNDLAVYKDFDGYVKKKYYDSMQVLLKDVKENSISVEMHHGYAADIVKYLFKEGCQIYEVTLPEVGFYRLYLAVKDNAYKWVICILDEGRVLHCQMTLKLSGIKSERVTFYDYFDDSYQEFKDAMECLIPKNYENVIIGLRGSYRRFIKRGYLSEQYLNNDVIAINELIAELGLKQDKNKSLLDKLINFKKEHQKLFCLENAREKLIRKTSVFQEYGNFEKDIERLRKEYPEYLCEIHTFLSTFQGFKTLIHELVPEQTQIFHRKIVQVFNNIASNAGEDAKLKGKYEKLANKLDVTFSGKSEIIEALNCDPITLHNNPSHLLNLIRFDEIVAAIQKDDPLCPEINMIKRALFPVVNIGEKYITPYFHGQIMSFIDNHGREKKLLLTDVPFSKQITYLIKYLISTKINSILFTGIGGGIFGLDLKDIVVPVYCDETGNPIAGVNNALIESFIKREKLGQNVGGLHVGGKNIMVDLPYDETYEWLEKHKESDAISVDLEVSRAAKVMRDLNSNIPYGAMLIMSDVIGVKHLDQTVERAYTKERGTLLDYCIDYLKINRVLLDKEVWPRNDEIVVNENGGGIKNIIGEFEVKFEFPRKDKKLKLEQISAAISNTPKIEDLDKVVDNMRKWFSASIIIKKINLWGIERTEAIRKIGHP